MDIEGVGFIIGLIGAIWMKSSMNLIRGYQEQPEVKMIGREMENPALKAFIRGLSLVLFGQPLDKLQHNRRKTWLFKKTKQWDLA